MDPTSSFWAGMKGRLDSGDPQVVLEFEKALLALLRSPRRRGLLEADISDLADRLIQKLFIGPNALAKRHPIQDLKKFCCTTALNLIKSELRRETRRKALPIEAAQHVAMGADPGDRLALEELKKRVEAAIQRLDPLSQRVFTLMAMEKKKAPEVVALFSRESHERAPATPGAVHELLKGARQKLRRWLGASFSP